LSKLRRKVETGCKRKAIYAPKTGGAAHLIISDGATLTARINIDEGQSLIIYGQEQNTGQLIAKPSVLSYKEDDYGVMRSIARYPAIGSEDGDGRRGSLKLADRMKVHAGQNPGDAAKHLFPFETRVPACYFRPYACIQER